MRVYTGGTFDLFHRGHVRFLQRCARFGPVTVAVNSDAFVKGFKGVRPTYTLSERVELVSACTHVAKVVVYDGIMSSWHQIQRLGNYEVIAIGSDWAARDYYAQMGFTQDELDAQGIVLVYLPYTPGISSTELRRRLRG